MRAPRAIRQDQPRGEAIRLAAETRKGGFSGPMRFGLMLVLFMRVVAALWIFQGLLQWNEILSPVQGGFEAVSAPVQLAVIFFAVFNPVAAVGLWLASPWGGVLWLFAVAAQIFSATIMPDFFAGGRVVLIIDVTLVIAYFVLTWYAAQERSA
jgi:hypothetical protein